MVSTSTSSSPSRISLSFLYSDDSSAKRSEQPGCSFRESSPCRAPSPRPAPPRYNPATSRSSRRAPSSRCNPRISPPLAKKGTVSFQIQSFTTPPPSLAGCSSRAPPPRSPTAARSPTRSTARSSATSSRPAPPLYSTPPPRAGCSPRGSRWSGSTRAGVKRSVYNKTICVPPANHGALVPPSAERSGTAGSSRATGSTGSSDSLAGYSSCSRATSQSLTPPSLSSRIQTRSSPACEKPPSKDRLNERICICKEFFTTPPPSLALFWKMTKEIESLKKQLTLLKGSSAELGATPPSPCPSSSPVQSRSAPTRAGPAFSPPRPAASQPPLTDSGIFNNDSPILDQPIPGAVLLPTPPAPRHLTRPAPPGAELLSPSPTPRPRDSPALAGKEAVLLPASLAPRHLSRPAPPGAELLSPFPTPRPPGDPALPARGAELLPPAAPLPSGEPGQPDVYKQFLEIIHTYKKSQQAIKEGGALKSTLTKAEAYAQVSKLFKDHEDLLAECGLVPPEVTNHGIREPAIANASSLQPLSSTVSIGPVTVHQASTTQPKFPSKLIAEPAVQLSPSPGAVAAPRPRPEPAVHQLTSFNARNFLNKIKIRFQGQSELLAGLPPPFPASRSCTRPSQSGPAAGPARSLAPPSPSTLTTTHSPSAPPHSTVACFDSDSGKGDTQDEDEEEEDKDQDARSDYTSSSRPGWKEPLWVQKMEAFKNSVEDRLQELEIENSYLDFQIDLLKFKEEKRRLSEN